MATIWRRFVLPVLLVVIVTLTPLGYASPPDPSWIKGVYDDADYDDVVVIIASGSGAVEPFLQVDLGLGRQLAAYAPPLEEDPVPTLTLSSVQPRAPPAS